MMFKDLYKVQSASRLVAGLPLHFKLRAAYHHGRGTTAARLEDVDHRLVQDAHGRLAGLFKQYRDKHTDSRLRVLFYMPSGGVGMFWWRNLMEALLYVGVPCAAVRYRDPDFTRRWNAFRPNVFICQETAENVQWLDLRFVAQYKAHCGCLRIFAPSVNANFPAPGMSSEDKRRLAMARSGLTADVYFSMMEPEFYAQFFPERLAAGLPYFTLPCGASPFVHYPVPGKKDLDYFVVTSYGPDRLRTSAQYLSGILRHHYGAWAGERWGFGMGNIAQHLLKYYYARTKTVPAPLLPFLVRYPSEITERAFSATACAGFVITNRTPVTQRFFNDNELVQVTSPREFADAFSHYLNRPGERNEILLRGIRKVFSTHTYFHRCEILLNEIKHNQPEGRQLVSS